jgi:predicted short-subunit dehydrogenase-like oxidoreductase (DUF2520 family)
MARRTLDVSIIGLGNWGNSLATALSAARIPLRQVVARRPRRSSLPVVGWKNAHLDARIIWLCVPDADISEVTEQIVCHRDVTGHGLAGQIVVHSSGALTASALKAAHRAGAQVASVHPVMTFPTHEAVSLENVYFGVETNDPGTRRILHSLIRKLGGKPFDLRSEDKAMYHAAATLASPLLVSALTAAMEAASLAGLDEKTASLWVQSLAEPTLRNVFANGAAQSFSGPFARGDAEVIRLHLKTLQPHPILAVVYRALAEHALDSLPVRNVEALAAALKTVKRSGKRTAK